MNLIDFIKSFAQTCKKDGHKVQVKYNFMFIEIIVDDEGGYLIPIF